MGTTYKFKQEVVDYIFELRRTEPSLGCRKLVLLVQDKFGITVSKSSINSVLKDSGLSMPVGRRVVKPLVAPGLPKEQSEFPYAGLFFVKLADLLLGGSRRVAEVVSGALGRTLHNVSSCVEQMLFSLLLERLQVSNEQKKAVCGFLVGKSIPQEEMDSFIRAVDANEQLLSDVRSAISGTTQEVRAIALSFGDHAECYLDAKFHSLWPSLKIPPVFSVLVEPLSSYLVQSDLLMLFMAPGYTKPTQSLLTLMSNLVSDKKPKISMYDSELKRIETSRLDINLPISLVFGLWPWQYGNSCSRQVAGDFQELSAPLLDTIYYIAPIQIHLPSEIANNAIKAQGCVVKEKSDNKTEFYILTNQSTGDIKIEDLAEKYLRRWPHPGNILTNFARNVENPGGDASEITGVLKARQELLEEQIISLNILFNKYLRIIDCFIKEHFLLSDVGRERPAALEEKLYNHKGAIKIENDSVIIHLIPSSEPALQKILQFACRSANKMSALHSLPPKLRFDI